MKFVQVPGGEYYLQKHRASEGNGSFIFLPRWRDNKNYVYAYINGSRILHIPRELVGKRLRVKLEIVEK